MAFYGEPGAKQSYLKIATLQEKPKAVESFKIHNFSFFSECCGLLVLFSLKTSFVILGIRDFCISITTRICI